MKYFSLVIVLSFVTGSSVMACEDHPYYAPPGYQQGAFSSPHPSAPVSGQPIADEAPVHVTVNCCVADSSCTNCCLPTIDVLSLGRSFLGTLVQMSGVGVQATTHFGNEKKQERKNR